MTGSALGTCLGLFNFIKSVREHRPFLDLLRRPDPEPAYLHLLVHNPSRYGLLFKVEINRCGDEDVRVRPELASNEYTSSETEDWRGGGKVENPKKTISDAWDQLAFDSRMAFEAKANSRQLFSVGPIKPKTDVTIVFYWHRASQHRYLQRVPWRRMQCRVTSGICEALNNG